MDADLAFDALQGVVHGLGVALEPLADLLVGAPIEVEGEHLALRPVCVLLPAGRLRGGRGGGAPIARAPAGLGADPPPARGGSGTARAARGGGKGVRLDVKTTGCSGKSYVVDYVDETQPDDLIFQVDPSVIVCVAPSVFPMVKGTQIDYVRKGLNASFEFNNPNVKGACGCGESFTL